MGGSVWDLKIDPKSSERRKKTATKKKKQKRRKNKHQEANRRSKNNVFDVKRIVAQWPGGMRGAAGEDYRRG